MLRCLLPTVLSQAPQGLRGIALAARWEGGGLPPERHLRSLFGHQRAVLFASCVDACHKQSSKGGRGGGGGNTATEALGRVRDSRWSGLGDATLIPQADVQGSGLRSGRSAGATNRKTMRTEATAARVTRAAQANECSGDSPPGNESGNRGARGVAEASPFAPGAQRQFGCAGQWTDVRPAVRACPAVPPVCLRMPAGKGTIGRIAVADVDGDGAAEFFVPDYTGGRLHVYTFAPGETR